MKTIIFLLSLFLLASCEKDDGYLYNYKLYNVTGKQIFLISPSKQNIVIEAKQDTIIYSNYKLEDFEIMSPDRDSTKFNIIWTIDNSNQKIDSVFKIYSYYYDIYYWVYSYPFNENAKPKASEVKYMNETGDTITLYDQELPVIIRFNDYKIDNLFISAKSADTTKIEIKIDYKGWIHAVNRTSDSDGFVRLSKTRPVKDYKVSTF